MVMKYIYYSRKRTFKYFRELLTEISVFLRYLAITWKIWHSPRPSQLTVSCGIHRSRGLEFFDPQFLMEEFGSC